MTEPNRWREIRAAREVTDLPATLLRMAKAIDPEDLADFNALHEISDGFLNRQLADVWLEAGERWSQPFAERMVRDISLVDPSVTRLYERVFAETAETIGLGQEAAGNLTLSRLRLQLSFRLTNPAAVAAAESAAGNLVTAVTAEQKLLVRDLITRGIAEGRSVPATARDLRRVVGLNNVQAKALRRFEEGLIQAGRKQSVIDRMVARRAKKMLRRRATTIARTELLRASNVGQRIAWKQAAEDGQLDLDKAEREWILDPGQLRADVCTPLDGERIRFSDEFSSGDPPLHPNCRCTIGLRRATVTGGES